MLVVMMAVLMQAQAPVQQQAKDVAKAADRCVVAAEAPDRRLHPNPPIAPGPPPVLSFRYFEGKLHQRFNNTDLMLDDAGH